MTQDNLVLAMEWAIEDLRDTLLQAQAHLKDNPTSIGTAGVIMQCELRMETLTATRKHLQHNSDDPFALGGLLTQDIKRDLEISRAFNR